MQTEVFGDFCAAQTQAEECLTLSFSPSTRPLQERWRNNGLSADFISDYFATFLPSDNTYKEEIKTAVSYIANELLENAMKFCDYAGGKSVTLHLDLESDRIVFILTNSINAGQKEKLNTFLAKFCTTDPMDYFIEQMEKNASEDSHSSGIGFVTMINDYNARIGWSIAGQDLEFVLTTCVYLPL